MTKKAKVVSRQLSVVSTQRLQCELLKRAIEKTGEALVLNDNQRINVFNGFLVRLQELNDERVRLLFKIQSQQNELARQFGAKRS